MALFSGPTSSGAQYQYTPRTLTVTVLPGSYDVAYQRNASSSAIFPEFPINEGDVFAPSRVISTSGTVALDVQRVDVTMPVSLNLASLSTLTSPSYVTSFPRIVLRPLASGGAPVTTALFTGPTSAGANYQYTPRALAFGLLPGRYDIGYERNASTSSIFGAFPANEGDTLVADRAITTSGPMVVDLPTVAVTMPVFLSQSPLLPLTNASYVTSFPRLEFRPRASQGQPFTSALFTGPFSSGALYEYRPATIAMTILPGTYDVAYRRNTSTSSIFGAFPVNEGDQLACFTVSR
jgi:hypothetical protein